MQPIVAPVVVVPPPSPSTPVFQRRFDSLPIPFSQPNFISPNSLLKAPPPPPPHPTLASTPPPSTRPPTLTSQIQVHLQATQPLISLPPPPPPKPCLLLHFQHYNLRNIKSHHLSSNCPETPKTGCNETFVAKTRPVGFSNRVQFCRCAHQSECNCANTCSNSWLSSRGRRITRRRSPGEEEEEELPPPPPPPPYQHRKPKFLENSFTQISTIIDNGESEVETSQPVSIVVEEQAELEMEIDDQTEIDVEESTMSDSRSVLSEMISSIVEQEEHQVDATEVKPLKRTVTFDTDEEDEVEGEEGMSSDGDSEGWSAEEDEEEESSETRKRNRIPEEPIMFHGQQQQDVQTAVTVNVSCEMDTYCDEPESEQQQDVKPMESVTSSPQKNTDGISQLLKDPKALLKRASDVLKKINESEVEKQELQIEYEQIDLDPEYTIEEEVKPLPDFHGEPVPEDDDDDDALFEIAAGISRPKKKDILPAIIEEPLPDDDFIELDYYNADMNIKASSSNKWLIEPDNGDGFALMWGGVRSNYAIAVNDEMRAGKVAFQVKIVEFLSLKHVPFEELEPHDVRLGGL
uniref:Uncharacterized protein n=1 Tax=Ditylenchus dipsaci TaxID=166011 RepID=A0A915DNY1_9BILA